MLLKTVFVLEPRARKVQVIMARCGPNLQTSTVLFSFLKRQITSLALKMERKNINRCLGGLKMEDQGERSPQTFLVNNFSLLQLRRNKTIGVMLRCSGRKHGVIKTTNSLYENNIFMFNSTQQTHGPRVM